METIEATLTNRQHSRQINRRLGIDDTKMSLLILIYERLWTSPRTTATTQICLLKPINRRRHHWNRLHSHAIGVQPLWHDRDYHNFYLLTDLILLADEFKIFRGVCLQHYGLDPANNYIFPGLSWQAALEWRTWNWTFSLILINIC